MIDNRTPEDVHAARIIMWGKDAPTHPDSVLEGHELCTHMLAGSGMVLSNVASVDPHDVHLWGKYTKQPYRHHVFTPNSARPSRHGTVWCYCGNSKGSLTHQRCWEK